MNDYVDKLWNSDAVACLDALKEADDAVETINRDMFSIIADVAADIVADGGDDNHSAVLKDTLKEFEKRYKKERSLKHMPGSYRSAKSTIVNAVKHGINLFDPIDGKLKGKSALEKEINQAKRDGGTQNAGVNYGPDYHIKSARDHLAHIVPMKVGDAIDTGGLKRNLDSIKEYVEQAEELYL